MFAGSALALFAAGLVLRLRALVVGLGNANYDEAVYWQTLRSMAAGHPLYQPTFFSQPPFFMQSTFATFALFGQTLWAARFGVVLISLLGLLGAFVIGYVLRGRTGAVVALLLLVGSASYLTMSRTLMAEAPCVALELLSVALAYVWWRAPTKRSGILVVSLAAAALVLSIMSKLFGLAAAVPLGMLAIARLWQIFQLPAEERWRASTSLIAGVAALGVTTALVLLPYVGSWHQLWHDAVAFHLAAKQVEATGQSANLRKIAGALRSPLSLVAAFGIVVAFIRREWLVLPLLAWLASSVYLLWSQVPLFEHHLVILAAPLVALAAMGVVPIPGDWRAPAHRWQVIALIGFVLVLAVAVGDDVHRIRQYRYQVRVSNAVLATNTVPKAVADLKSAVPAGKFVITDAPDIAGYADRSTPPDLVDTSFVRIKSYYLTSQQLITDASEPDVSAVLYYSGRLSGKRLNAFYAWVKGNLRLAHAYGTRQELWVKR